MNIVPIPVVVRIAAAVASIATSWVLPSAVVSLSEPQRTQLIASTASRQMATQNTTVLVAKAQHLRPTVVAAVTRAPP
jgi:hypothetical protein